MLEVKQIYLDDAWSAEKLGVGLALFYRQRHSRKNHRSPVGRPAYFRSVVAHRRVQQDSFASGFRFDQRVPEDPRKRARRKVPLEHLSEQRLLIVPPPS